MFFNICNNDTYVCVLAEMFILCLYEDLPTIQLEIMFIITADLRAGNVLTYGPSSSEQVQYFMPHVFPATH